VSAPLPLRGVGLQHVSVTSAAARVIPDQAREQQHADSAAQARPNPDGELIHSTLSHAVTSERKRTIGDG